MSWFSVILSFSEFSGSCSSLFGWNMLSWLVEFRTQSQASGHKHTQTAARWKKNWLMNHRLVDSIKPTSLAILQSNLFLLFIASNLGLFIQWFFDTQRSYRQTFVRSLFSRESSQNNVAFERFRFLALWEKISVPNSSQAKSAVVPLGMKQKNWSHQSTSKSGGPTRSYFQLISPETTCKEIFLLSNLPEKASYCENLQVSSTSAIFIIYYLLKIHKYF